MTNIGIDDKNRDQVGKILNRVLADEYVLYTKTRGYHWNVVGPQFNDLHKFFEGQYEELQDIIDDVAERGRSIGVHALGSLQEMLDEKSLEEDTTKGADSKHMLRSLLSDHEAIIRKLRVDLEKAAEKHKDMGTSDFLTGLMEKHEKMAWMLRSNLED
ncbi:MAG TPA: DNA starvation/stationary phase protection protein [Thermodesulfobacteriota bacterium]|nr:DNA starvation/stationary phase protection protein [Thermodesulfobacteriota bacterium]